MKKCSTCSKVAIGVIPSLFGHRYVCEEHAKLAEKDGWGVDYENWRLSV